MIENKNKNNNDDSLSIEVLDVSTDEIQEEEQEEQKNNYISLDNLSNESPNEFQKRMESMPDREQKKDGDILTIKEVRVPEPYTVDRDGVQIPPHVALNNKNVKYYPVKLHVLFEEKTSEGRDLIDYYPGIKYFVKEVDGVLSVNPVPSFTKKQYGNNPSSIAMLYEVVSKYLKKDIDDFSDNEFAQVLIGKKVKIKVTTGIHQGSPWFRNDIESIVK